jgi:hypothetical protein
MALAFLVISLATIVAILALSFRGVKESVEAELDKYKDDEEMQAEIRKRVVKAVFPPRFDR